jgi:molybdate transport system ATP-binding protein
MAERFGAGGPFISLEDVSLRLYDRLMFEGTRWEIGSDQHWAVLGPNGAGKSTLVKALCGRVPVVRGRIAYHFCADGALPQDRVAYVSLDDGDTPLGGGVPFYQSRWNVGVREASLSVGEYLSEDRLRRRSPFQVLERPADPGPFIARQARVLGLLDIEDLLTKDVLHLSDGERRKVLIARALLRDPRLLILDNPFTGLDPRFRTRLREAIARLMGHELRVMVVTARPDEIPPGITHVLAVEEGQVVAQGPRQAVLDRDRVRRMVGSGLPSGLRLTFPQDRQAEDGRPILEVLVHMEGVNVSYGRARILRQVTWTVRQGENWALLGPNGAGKTTLLSLILGDHPQAYANDITLFGRRRGSGESIWEIKRQVGWVAPELHLYYPRHVSCADVVCSGFYDSIGLYQRCTPAQRRAASSWMDYLGISRYAEKGFNHISQGEQRMMLIARALVKRPLLLVLDEPCQGLDARNRDRILQIVDALVVHLDTSVIYVTHRHDELPRAITHLLRLQEGRVAYQGRRSGPRRRSRIEQTF